MATVVAIAIGVGWLVHRIELHRRRTSRSASTRGIAATPPIPPPLPPATAQVIHPLMLVSGKEALQQTAGTEQLLLPKTQEQKPAGFTVVFPLPKTEGTAPLFDSNEARIEEPTPPEPIRIDSRYDDWRGQGEDRYPPDWKSRTLEVRIRDGHRCQIVGCPSCEKLHVHHIKAIKDGGNHALANLITLCELHHAFMPGHLEDVGEIFESARYSVVTGFMRRNPGGHGFHYVQPHLTRRLFIDEESSALLIAKCDFRCPRCA